MDSIRIKNVRGVVDTKGIDIKPVTILLGRNGSGKSTFARCFPLIKQSCVENKKNPLVFNGQYVDFGDYSTAKSMFGGDICVDFNINPKNIESEIIPSYLFDSIGEEVLSYRINFSAVGERDNYVSNIYIASDSYKISLTVSETLRIKKAMINGIDCSEFLSGFSIIPGMVVPMLCEGKRRVPFMWLSETSTPVKAFVGIVREHCHQRVSKGSILGMIYKFHQWVVMRFWIFLRGTSLVRYGAVRSMNGR